MKRQTCHLIVTGQVVIWDYCSWVADNYAHPIMFNPSVLLTPPHTFLLFSSLKLLALSVRVCHLVCVCTTNIAELCHQCVPRHVLSLCPPWPWLTVSKYSVFGRDVVVILVILIWGNNLNSWIVVPVKAIWGSRLLLGSQALEFSGDF